MKISLVLQISSPPPKSPSQMPFPLSYKQKSGFQKALASHPPNTKNQILITVKLKVNFTCLFDIIGFSAYLKIWEKTVDCCKVFPKPIEIPVLPSKRSLPLAILIGLV